MDEFGSRLHQLETHLPTILPHLSDVILDVAKDLRRHYAGLSDPNRPMGVYLLLGASAQNPLFDAFTELFFDTYPIYIDMVYYTTADSFERIKRLLTDIDSAPGNKVLVFADVEQAHPSVRALLAALFKNAYLDAQHIGAFTNTVFFMTTHIADQLALEEKLPTLNNILGRPFVDPISLIFDIIDRDPAL